VRIRNATGKTEQKANTPIVPRSAEKNMAEMEVKIEPPASWLGKLFFEGSFITAHYATCYTDFINKVNNSYKSYL
jgi:hypothetical protein